MLDTGAIDGNYIKASVVDKLVKDNVVFTYRTCNKLVCSAFNSCVKINKNVYFSVTLTYLSLVVTISIVAEVVEQLPYDLVIGLQTIRKYRLTERLFLFFIGWNTCSSDNPGVATTHVQSSAIDSRGMPRSMPVEPQPHDSLALSEALDIDSVTKINTPNLNGADHSFNMIKVKRLCTCHGKTKT